MCLTYPWCLEQSVMHFRLTLILHATLKQDTYVIPLTSDPPGSRYGSTLLAQPTFTQ